METNQDVLDRMVHLSVREDKIQEEFEKDFGSQLRLTKGALLIQEIGNRLCCNLFTVTKAMVLYHKSKFNSSNLAPVACLNLSIKLAEEKIAVDEVILKSYKAILETSLTPPVEELEQLKKNLYLAECAICRSMSYKLDCEIPHEYVFKVLTQLQSLTDASNAVIISLSSTIVKLLSTYYLCERSLDYTPKEIAFACLQFAFLYCGGISPSVKYLLRKELLSVPNKDRIGNIVDDLIIVSDVSTTLEYI